MYTAVCTCVHLWLHSTHVYLWLPVFICVPLCTVVIAFVHLCAGEPEKKLPIPFRGTKSQ